MQHPTESAPSDDGDVVSDSDVLEAFKVGQQIEQYRTAEAIAALERIQKRFDDAEVERRNSYARGYIDGLDGREPEFTSLYERVRGTRKQHAFTVERTAGDHFVWRCRCGDVLIQDPGNTTIHEELIKHAKGGKR